MTEFEKLVLRYLDCLLGNQNLTIVMGPPGMAAAPLHSEMLRLRHDARVAMGEDVACPGDTTLTLDDGRTYPVTKGDDGNYALNGRIIHPGDSFRDSDGFVYILNLGRQGWTGSRFHGDEKILRPMPVMVLDDEALDAWAKKRQSLGLP